MLIAYEMPRRCADSHFVLAGGKCVVRYVGYAAAIKSLIPIFKQLVISYRSCLNTP